jgi:hypothetical protein
MSLQKNNKSILIEYKFLKEEKESIEDLYKQGLNDLGLYLHELKGQLSEKVEGQIEKFEEQFFNKQKDIEELIKEAEENAFNKKEDLNTNGIKESWAKKIYREIVQLTHPDKTSLIPIPKIANKLLNYYNIAVDAYSSNKYEELIYVAYELDIEIPEEKIFEHILPKVKILKEDIKNIKGTFPFQWQIIEEEKRSIILQNYLKSIGYVFENKVLNEIFEKVKRIKRKPGTKPVNYLKQRLKLK